MVDQNKLGIFPWYSLGTKSAPAVAEYYAKLLDLKISTMEMPGLGKTTILNKGEKAFADVSTITPSTLCHWAVYLTVENVEKFLPKAKKFGATVVGEPFDIPEIGKGAMVKDPGGAMFIAFTPKDWNRTSAAHGMEEGMICWNELMVEDPKKVLAFYSECFGWKFKTTPGVGATEYHSITNAAGVECGGILKRPAAAAQFPPMWMVYFLTQDVVASTKKATSLGGVVTMPVTEIPSVGKFSMMKDPQDGMFYLFTPYARKN